MLPCFHPHHIKPEHLARQWRIRYAFDNLLPVGAALGAIVDLPVIAVDHLDGDGRAHAT
ncbi:hypothetical protein ABI_40950 [Asticcacaulis biprosthecium C19]|uniref:Uncharacterized protein n=1 Tax=Asticcacaulis biprosthecium C19 TaxID=715226 RepID=F4QSF2_9CAUL|nr:hypothetical protein ABI_40950 [Asticcacaulis biprosthecium C19]